METLEASLLLQVGHQPDEDSDDEEAITRKGELIELLDQELCDDLLEDSEEELTFYSPPPKTNELLSSNWHYTTNNNETVVADVLKGTSQAYENGGGREMIPSASPVCDTPGVSVPVGDTRLYNHLGRPQLEALYHSKCQQMKEMEAQINIFQEEQDKKLGALRHLNRQLESEKLTLLEDLEKQHSHCNDLTQKVTDYDNMILKIDLMVKQNEELTVQLLTAQATIQSLTTQLTDLSQTDAIQKLRQNYETALIELQKQHKMEIGTIQSQQQVSSSPVTISSVLEENQENLTRECVESSCNFNGPSIDHGHEIEQERRELIAQIEDLTCQVLSEQEKVTVAEEKTQNLQLLFDELKSATDIRISNQKEQIDELQFQLDNHQITYETKLKTSLEQCRLACLKLHEDAAKRLKEEFVTERNETEHQHVTQLEILRKEIASLKSSLVTTQQQLVESNRQKQTVIEESLVLKQQLDESQSNKTIIERNDSKWQHKVDMAVAAARKVWIDEEDKRTKEIIQLSLKQVNERHSMILKKLMTDKEETIKQLEETNRYKLVIEQELKKTKDKLKKASIKSNNLEIAVREMKQSLPLLQTDLLNLMNSTLMAVVQKTSNT